MSGLERRFALFCAAAGVFLLIVGSAIFLAEQRMTNAVSYSLIAGVALLVSYAILDPGALVAAVRSRQIRFGSLSVLVSAAFLAILVVTNLLAARGTQSLDLTSAQRYTLSPKSLVVAKRLTVDLKVTGFFRPSEATDRATLEQLLAQYQVASPHVKVNFEDPDTHLEDVRRLGVRIPGSIALEYRGKPPVILTLASQREQDITSAILKLESNKTPLICWAAGDGERDLTQSQDPSGYSEADIQLKQNNYATKDFLLSGQAAVPGECDLLAVVGLQRPLSDGSVKSVLDYLAGGGKLLLAVDPWQDQPVIDSANRLLKPYGASFHGGLVIDPDPSHSALQDPTTPIVFDYGNSPIANGISKRLSYFPQSTAIDAASSDKAAALVLASSSRDSYEVQLPRQDVVPRKSVDKPGPFNLMATLDGTDPGRHPRLVVVGTSSLAENRALPPQERSGGVNLQLFLGSFDWLSGQEDLIAIPAKPPEATPLALTQQDLAFNIFLTAFVMPGVIILGGLLVWLRRRSSF